MDIETAVQTDADAQARLDLAAVHRPLARHGWGDVIVNYAAMRFCNRVGCHDYEGLTDSFDERERIVAALGKNRALIMRHHGITMVGETAREAFSLMKEFVRAARIQLQMEATGAELLEIPPEVCERVAAQYEQHDRGRASAEWPVYLRQLDAVDPGYRN